MKALAEALLGHGFKVWLDEWDLEVGDSIVQNIQDGLQRCEFVAVWLTESSIHSGWAAKEWQSKVFSEVSTKKISVLPLLAEDCDVPFFLSDKKYADFRTSFDHGLAQLLRALKRKPPEAPRALSVNASASVLRNVQNFLNDLEQSQIPLPLAGNIKLIPTLKALPRSGKLIRLEKMTPKLPIRSIYDHILSVGHSCDVLLPELRPKLAESDLVELARVVAYHDLCEVILGDLPQYTRLNATRRRRARVEAEVRLSQFPNGVPERIVNQFIGMFLHDSERHSLEAAQKIMDGTSEIRRYYYAMDKLDPIIGTWRYIFLFRNAQGFSIEEYLERMRHFFENPNVARVMEKNVDDRRFLQFVRELQTPSLARAYFEEPELLSKHLFSLPGPVVKALVERRAMSFVSG